MRSLPGHPQVTSPPFSAQVRFHCCGREMGCGVPDFRRQGIVGAYGRYSIPPTSASPPRGRLRSAPQGTGWAALCPLQEAPRDSWLRSRVDSWQSRGQAGAAGGMSRGRGRCGRQLQRTTPGFPHPQGSVQGGLSRMWTSVPCAPVQKGSRVFKIVTGHRGER